MRLLHNGASLRCFRDSVSVADGGMHSLIHALSILRFIHSAKKVRHFCLHSCETAANIDCRIVLSRI